MRATDEKPLTDRQAFRTHREWWVNAGLGDPECDKLEQIARDYARAATIGVQAALGRVTEIVHRELGYQLDSEVRDILNTD